LPTLLPKESGDWAWVLGSVQAVKPFAIKGKLGFFDVPDRRIVRVGKRRKNPDPSRKDEAEPPAPERRGPRGRQPATWTF
jgi:hypothetical protein